MFGVFDGSYVIGVNVWAQLRNTLASVKSLKIVFNLKHEFKIVFLTTV